MRAAASEAGVEGGREELGPGGTPMPHPFPVLQPLPPLSPRPLLQCPTVSLWRTKKITEHARGGRRFCMNKKKKKRRETRHREHPREQRLLAQPFSSPLRLPCRAPHVQQGPARAVPLAGAPPRLLSCSSLLSPRASRGYCPGFRPCRLTPPSSCVSRSFMGFKTIMSPQETDRQESRCLSVCFACGCLASGPAQTRGPVRSVSVG